MADPQKPKRLCKGHSKQTGEPCKLPPVPGALVCRFHGGNTPQARAAAERRLAAASAQDAAQRLAVPIDTTPEQALLDEVKRAAGMVAFYQARIIEVDEFSEDPHHDLVWGITKDDKSGEFPGPMFEAAPNVWLTLFNQERDRLVRVASAAIKAGIEERRVKLAEQQGSLIAAVLKRILDEMLTVALADSPNTLPARWAEAVSIVVPRELRQLTA